MARVWLVFAPARPGLAGDWTAATDAGICQLLYVSGLSRRFVLPNAQTAQRMAQSKLVTLWQLSAVKSQK